MKSNSKSHFAAFTVLELCVSMIVAGILITIAYQAYTMTLAQLIKSEVSLDELSEQVLLDQVIRRDTDAAQVVAREGENTLVFKHAEIMYQYVFYPQVVVRREFAMDQAKEPLNQRVMVDSFHVASEDMRFEAMSTGALKSISFVSKVGNMTIPFFYGKQYSEQDQWHHEQGN